MVRKPVVWVGSSRRDLKALSEEIRDTIGSALLTAQWGDKPENAKALKGFGGAHVLEIIEYDSAGTYRAIYTVKFEDVIYVLHVFQKKSKSGIVTPKQEIDIVKSRLKVACEHYQARKKVVHEK